MRRNQNTARLKSVIFYCPLEKRKSEPPVQSEKSGLLVKKQLPELFTEKWWNKAVRWTMEIRTVRWLSLEIKSELSVAECQIRTVSWGRWTGRKKENQNSRWKGGISTIEKVENESPLKNRKCELSVEDVNRTVLSVEKYLLKKLNQDGLLKKTHWYCEIRTVSWKGLVEKVEMWYQNFLVKKVRWGSSKLSVGA